MRIVLFNPALSTLNLGDEIIVDSCMRELSKISSSAQFASLSTPQPMGRVIPSNLKNVDYRFVCGTNLLKAGMLFGFRQWQVSYLDTWFAHNAILLGCGWWQYQEGIDWYSKKLWRKVLSHHELHSVRDEYTLSKLADMGIKNAINTGCPTMWELDSRHCSGVSAVRAESVVTTLTDYNRNEAADNYLLEVLASNYKTVYLWPQGFRDLEYLGQLRAPSNLVIVEPSLSAYDYLLGTQDIEYIGTRLHGGIRALQKSKRTLIIAVDNRATEKQRDFNLNVVQRSDLSRLEEYIGSISSSTIKINEREIEKFRQKYAITK